jgi:hypothetical protein
LATRSRDSVLYVGSPIKLNTNADAALPHARGDWGAIDEEDQGRNDQALVTGDRLLSVYPIAEGVTIWVITEAADEDGDRAGTTLLLPDEY